MTIESETHLPTAWQSVWQRRCVLLQWLVHVVVHTLKLLVECKAELECQADSLSATEHCSPRRFDRMARSCDRVKMLFFRCFWCRTRTQHFYSSYTTMMDDGVGHHLTIWISKLSSYNKQERRRSSD
jgi:hypothetical protein